MKFFGPVNLAGDEQKLLLRCLKSKNWSVFKGALSKKDYHKVLNISSEDAYRYGDLDIRFLGGKYVRQLEKVVARKFNVKYCISSNSATSCLHMALSALNIGPGDEVIVPSMSFNSTATSVLYVNAIPKFCEVDEDTFNLCEKDFEKKISKNTKAVIVVHLGGCAARMNKIMKIAKRNNIKIIEDCAQAPGVKYNKKFVGTFGDAGIYSLTETKNISSGEGGLLITNNTKIAARSRLVRNHGEGVILDNFQKEDLENIVGMNYRMTEFQAAVAIPQFKNLDKINIKRKKLCSYLLKGLSKYSNILIPQKVEKNVEYYPYILKFLWKGDHILKREILIKKLNNAGVPFTGGYSRMMHQNPIFKKKIAYKNGCPFFCNKNKNITKNNFKINLPISEDINKKFLWFKFINPPNTKKHMDFIIRSFDKILNV